MFGKESDNSANEDLMQFLEANGESSLKFAKQRYVWDLNNPRSVISIIRVSLRDYFRPDLSEEQEGGRTDYDYKERIALQILEHPLLYIRKTCGESTLIGYMGERIVHYNGLSSEEAEEMIDKVLSLINHSKDDFRRILEIPRMAQQALKILQATQADQEQSPQKSSPTEEEQQAIEDLRKKMEELNSPTVPLDLRKN